MQAEAGALFRHVAEEIGVHFGMPCGGKGRCGKCKVIFQKGAPEPTPAEHDRLSEIELIQGYRLGCVTTLSDDAVVYMPNGGKGIQSAKILAVGTARDVALFPCITKRSAVVPKPTVEDLRSDLARVLETFQINRSQSHLDLSSLRRLGNDLRNGDFKVTGVFSDGNMIALESGDTTADCYAVAFDIGTTTLAAYLIDLNSGHQVSVASAINPQTRVGDDVISRISYVMQEADGLDRLRMSVTDELNQLLKTLCEAAKVSADRVYEASVVGNTCMTHLFLGIDPTHLAQAPYVPTVSQSVYIPAPELGLEINPSGRIHVLPNIAGYVGADTVGVVVASALHLDDQLTLAVDIGTNGEIVLGSKDRMVACSTAAGPAFEGAHIKFGMRAAPGAIDGVWLEDNQIHVSTIGGEKAVGLCGSGLLDAIICLVNAGIIDSGGRIVDKEEVPEEFAHLRSRLQDGERGNDFVLTLPDESTSEPVLITQRDVRELQLAKAAIGAGIHSLMDKLNVSVDDLDKVVLAGAFGNYVRKESAIAAGMIPNVPLSKVHSVGNAAGEGAKLALISKEAREDADRIATSIEYIELTTDPGFQERFADALMFGCGSLI